MTGENNSSENIIKDTASSLSSASSVSSNSIISYDKESVFLNLNSKTNKLITALYMVTDIMDKDEPLRNKLRSAATDVLSDMHVISYRTEANLINKNINKIREIVSFLEVASTIRMISEMNFTILKKEFTNLKESLSKHNNPILIEDFLNSNNNEDSSVINNINNKEINESESVSLKNAPHPNPLLVKERGRENSIARIGIQKGSTLMKAIRDIKKDTKTLGKANMSNRKNIVSNESNSLRSGFDNLKKERRDIIIKIIKDKKQATITDIKTFASGVLVSCGEKTLQRELISMVNDGVLKKIGEKRWSKYFIK